MSSPSIWLQGAEYFYFLRLVSSPGEADTPALERKDIVLSIAIRLELRAEVSYNNTFIWKIVGNNKKNVDMCFKR